MRSVRISCIAFTAAAVVCALPAASQTADKFFGDIARTNAVKAHAAVPGKPWRVASANSESDSQGFQYTSYYKFAGNKGDRIKVTATTAVPGKLPMFPLDSCRNFEGYRASVTDFVPGHASQMPTAKSASATYILTGSGIHVCTLSFDSTNYGPDGRRTAVPLAPNMVVIQKL